MSFVACDRECLGKKDIPFRELSKQECQANGAHVHMAMHMGKGAGCKRQIASAEERRGEAGSGSLLERRLTLISMLQENALDQVSKLDKTTDLVSLCLRVRKSDAVRRRLFVVISQASLDGAGAKRRRFCGTAGLQIISTSQKDGILCMHIGRELSIERHRQAAAQKAQMKDGEADFDDME